MSDMVDIIRAIKNILDVHGAWVFGGTLAAGLIAHKSRKRKSLESEWTYVQCIGCGRGGYSDEMRSGQDASGKEHYSCARCSRPDLFRQAEDVDYSTIVYRVRILDLGNDYDNGENYHYRSLDRAMDHVNNTIKAYDWYKFKEIPTAGKRRKWKTTSGENWEIMMTPIRLGNIVREADESFEDFRRRMVGDAAIAGDMGYMEALEEYYQDYLEEFESRQKEMCPDPKTFEQFQEMVLNNDYEEGFAAEYDYDEYGFITYPSAERLLAKILMDDPNDYEVGDHILIVDGTIVEVGGNSQMDFFEREDFWDNCDEYMIIVITGVDPYTFDITDFIQSEPVSHGAEDYGVGAVWMADSYDPAIHGNTIPTGSVKRFLEKIPVGQMFHVQFVKSNGDIREMDAFFNKPYSPDSITANVMERTATGAVFKRFRVDRVVGLYRV
jgi:hypothetical protein